MHRYLLPLSLAALLFAAQPSLAREGSASGVDLYKAAVTKAKLEVQPVKANYPALDEKEALKISQGAIGNQVGDYTFLDKSGHTVRLSDYRGKPLVISMIFTRCPFVCATTTRSLSALKLSQDALGADSFGVLTVGFDTENDTPEAMDDFGKRTGIDLTNWKFVSSDPETIKKLSRDLGFSYYPTDEGDFNHITQTTLIDRQGKVNLQIYGEEFNNKTLLEPLKNLIYNVKASDPIYNFKAAEPGFAGVAKSVRLFCTVYDSKAGKYVINYNEFIAYGMGIFVSLLVTWWIMREYRRSPKRSYPRHV